MPTYEYQCKACGHQLEAFQKMSDAPLTECPACHQTQLNKLVSATNFQLKGTGWYATDFKDKGKKPKVETSADKNETKESDSSSKESKDNTTQSSQTKDAAE